MGHCFSSLFHGPSNTSMHTTTIQVLQQLFFENYDIIQIIKIVSVKSPILNESSNYELYVTKYVVFLGVLQHLLLNSKKVWGSSCFVFWIYLIRGCVINTKTETIFKSLYVSFVIFSKVFPWFQDNCTTSIKYICCYSFNVSKISSG